MTRKELLQTLTAWAWVAFFMAGAAAGIIVGIAIEKDHITRQFRKAGYVVEREGFWTYWVELPDKRPLPTPTKETE